MFLVATMSWWIKDGEILITITFKPLMLFVLPNLWRFQQGLGFTVSLTKRITVLAYSGHTICQRIKQIGGGIKL